MLIKLSCGIIPTKIEKDGNYKFLTIKHNKDQGGDYSFPKGHIENMENIVDCAYRETFEETGISKENIKIIDNIFFENNYTVEFIGQKIFKKVIFFIGFIEGNPEIKIQKSEVESYEFLTFDEIRSKNPYENFKKMLDDVKLFLDKYLQK